MYSKNSEFVNQILNSVEELEEVTSRSLGISLLNKDLDFQINDGVMSANCRPSKILDLNEAIILGKMIQGKGFDEVVTMMKSDFKIVFLDSETLGSDIDVKEIKLIQTTTSSSLLVRFLSDFPKMSTVITNKHILKEEQLKDAHKLKLICVTATGVNNIDLEYCKAAGITSAMLKAIQQMQ